MAADTHAAADFYATPRGAVAERLLCERLALLWPDLRGQAVLGIGFAEPYQTCCSIACYWCTDWRRPRARDGCCARPGAC
jgi:hypothetical protein